MARELVSHKTIITAKTYINRAIQNRLDTPPKKYSLAKMDEMEALVGASEELTEIVERITDDADDATEDGEECP
jgi:hypothetical protein